MGKYDDKETYEQDMHCSNCGHSEVQSFRRGQTCKGLHTCSNCGTLSARAQGVPDRDGGIRMRVDEKTL